MPDLDWSSMSDRELLVHLATVCNGMRGDITELKNHQEETDDMVSNLNESRLRTEGAITMLKWLGGALIAALTASAALAGAAVAIAG